MTYEELKAATATATDMDAVGLIAEYFRTWYPDLMAKHEEEE